MNTTRYSSCVLMETPMAFLDTLKRNNSTKILNTWHISPARRKMFIILAQNYSVTRFIVTDGVIDPWIFVIFPSSFPKKLFTTALAKFGQY